MGGLPPAEMGIKTFFDPQHDFLYSAVAFRLDFVSSDFVRGADSYLLNIVSSEVFEDVGKYVIDGVIYTLNKTLVHRLAASLTLKRYCRLQLAGPNKYLHVPASIDISLEIDDIFVPLILENRGMNAAFNNASVLDAGNRIRIIGDPGSGKSSAAKWIFRNECRRAVAAPEIALPSVDRITRARRT